jgi:hypothetical protein
VGAYKSDFILLRAECGSSSGTFSDSDIMNLFADPRILMCASAHAPCLMDRRLDKVGWAGSLSNPKKIALG